MKLNDYQREAERFAVPPKEDGNQMLGINEAVFGLLEEAGEVAGKFKRVYRGDRTLEEASESIKKELGDVLWYLSQLSLRLGYTLEEVAKDNIAKLEDRLVRGKIKGEGDNR